jgi:hypothetical protein
MSDSFMIEVNGVAVGIVVRHRRGFRFHASDRSFAALECCVFRRPADAERSAALLMRSIRDAKKADSLQLEHATFPLPDADRGKDVDFGDQHLGRTCSDYVRQWFEQ